MALVVLLLVAMDPTATEVVDKVSDCDEFFLDKNPPYIKDVLEGGNIQDQNRYKAICQRHGATKKFMTLYDTKKKIPVFSACKYTGHVPSERWALEPWVI